jgi:hypothetical protein
MNPDAFAAAVRELGLSPFMEELKRVSLPCLDIVAGKAASPVAASQSKIGGMPDLPPGVAWPFSDNGVPLRFLGRVAAGDVARIYPGIRSHLLFFAEWTHALEGMVLAVAPDEPTVPAECPPRPADADPPLVECSVTVTEGVSLPDDGTGPERELYSKELLAFGAYPDPFWGKKVMRNTLEELVGLSSADPGPGQGVFRFGGYPVYVQSHPIECVPSGSGVTGISDLAHLMSFGDDETAGLGHGDTGFCGFLTTRVAVESGLVSPVFFYQNSM